MSAESVTVEGCVMRRPSRSSVLAAVVACAATIVPMTAASAAPTSRLPSNKVIKHAVAHSRHPYLHSFCQRRDGRRYAVLQIDRTRTHGVPVAVVSTSCWGGTATTPVEVAVYRVIDNRVRPAYVLRRGNEHKGRQYLLTLHTHSFRPGAVWLRIAGYGPRDHSCCPSHLYRQRYAIGLHGAHAGPLRPVAVPVRLTLLG
jgi:hypothetical protein